MPYFYMTHKDTREIKKFYGWMHNAGGNTCVEITSDMKVPDGFRVVLEDVENPWGNHLTILLPVDWEIYILRVRYQYTATHHEWRNLVVYPEVPEEGQWQQLSGYECPEGFTVYGCPDRNPVAVKASE